MKAGVSEELKMLDGMARDFAARELVEEREEHDRYPFAPLYDEVLGKALEVGFFSLVLPEEAGGSAEPVSALCVVLDEICRADASLGGAIFTQALAQEIARQAGESDLQQAAAAEDGSLREAVTAFPTYDNPAESGCCARAAMEGGEWKLYGVVEYVVLGGLVNRAILPARTGGMEGYSFFLVDLDRPCVSASEPVLSLGMHACPASDLTLSGAPGRPLGEEGKGGDYFEAAADRLSVAAAAMASGIIKGSFADALEYCRQREQGGRNIVNWSEVRMILSSMAVSCKVADMLVECAARAVDRGEPGWALASRAAALQAHSLAAEATSNGIQLLGGYGYMKDYGQEKRFRDAKQAQSLLGMAPLRRLEYVRRAIDGEASW